MQHTKCRYQAIKVQTVARRPLKLTFAKTDEEEPYERVIVVVNQTRNC